MTDNGTRSKPSVRVKPLEWVPIGPSGSGMEAHTPVGTYVISVDSPTAGGIVSLWMAGADVGTFEVFGFRKSAMIAAQENFNARILSAIEETEE